MDSAQTPARTIARQAAELAAESLAEDALIAGFAALVGRAYPSATVRIGLFSGEELRTEFPAPDAQGDHESIDLAPSDLTALRANETILRAGETIAPVRYASRTLGVIGARSDR